MNFDVLPPISPSPNIHSSFFKMEILKELTFGNAPEMRDGIILHVLLSYVVQMFGKGVRYEGV